MMELTIIHPPLNNQGPVNGEKRIYHQVNKN